MSARSLCAPVAIGLALAAGCGGGDGDESAPTTAGDSGSEVEMFDLGFRPADLEVDRGVVVRWINVGQQIHTVKQLPGSREDFFSKAVDAGESYRHRFDRRGTFRYFCTLHPTQMKASITVR